MFTVATISDLVTITPEDFGKTSAQAIEDNINAKYADKVIQGVGLCISFFDLLNASEGLIGNGTGFVNINVEFRMTVFRPFKGEVLQGQILQTVEGVGIQISMEFFEDIWVLCPKSIPRPSSLEEIESEKVWVWHNPENDADYCFDKHEQVRFRVEGEIWNDQASKQQGEPKAPYLIIGSMLDDGLGQNSWWDY